MNAAPARLVLNLPGRPEQIYALSKTSITLGRAAVSDIIIRDPKASRAHARVEVGDVGCELVDLESANGTLLNGTPVEKAILQPGDVISIGQSTLRYEIGLAAGQAGAEEHGIQAIDSESELDATMAEATLAQTFQNNQFARLAIYTPEKTWEIPLTGDKTTIGRQASNDIMIVSGRVSREHAVIERRRDDWVLRDLGSTNGTWAGGQRIDEVTLHNGETTRIGGAQLVFKAPYVVDDLTVVEDVGAARHSPRHPVVVVPGIMGSELWQGSERVWPNPRLLFTRPDVFKLPADDPDAGNPLDPQRILGEVVLVPNLVKLEQYDRLGDYLVEALGYERGKDLLEFPYDWRRDVRLSARRLAETIDAWDVTPPVTVIAHSLGTLVSRYYVERLGGKQKVGRLLLVGGPHSGVPKAITTLLQGPDILPFGLLGERLRGILASFPSAYQILPVYPCMTDQDGSAIDVLDDASWPFDAQRPFVRLAREFKQELGMRTSVPTVSIFGYGLKTITNLRINRSPTRGWHGLDSNTAAGGDGTVPDVSAVLEGSEIHPVQQYHGTLYVDSDVKMRLKIELLR